MLSLDTFLVRAIASIPHPTATQREILHRLNNLGARLEEGQLRVAVLGQFKRGKSTLLNALLGAPLLPTGITPVTAIPSFIKAGAQTSANIKFSDDKQSLLVSDADEIPAVLDRYVSEVENPHNVQAVAGVELAVSSEFLKQGVVLVDTPGVGSTFLHNTQAAEAVLTECDAAVFVTSADPPITEIEIAYLCKVQRLIPKIFFVLNKIDLLDSRERRTAESFLSGVLQQQPVVPQPIQIFAISAKQALRAKQTNDAGALAASGIEDLEKALTGELAREKAAIVFATGRLRLISLIGELLFQSELEQKALLLPEESLRQKAAIFESSVAGFETERQTLADFLSVDRKGLLKDLEFETNRLWEEADGKARQLVGEVVPGTVDWNALQGQVATMLSRHFEEAFRRSIELFRLKLSERLAVHQERAGALINLVRQTAADLMEISVTLPKSAEAFEATREPYWVAPEPAASILGITAGVVAKLMPRPIRDKWQRRQFIADMNAAVLRNIANLDWAIRQNVDDAFRRFASSLDKQLESALAATREAMGIAVERRAAQADEAQDYITDSANSVAALSEILTELQRLDSPVLS